MLSRLGIRQKLSLLLTIPLVAVVLVMVPFVAERINDARSAGVTARTANAARQIGVLIQSLQQERLLALGYLATNALDRSALLAQSQQAIDEAAALHNDPDTAAFVAGAQDALDSLDAIRQGVLRRAVDSDTTYAAYRSANNALLVALGLGRPTGADAAGLGQLGALDALMRSNEEASSIGAILVIGSVDDQVNVSLLNDAVTADQQYLRRFGELADPAEVALVTTVDNGAAGQRIRTLSANMTASADSSTATDVSDALSAALSYTGLRRLAQDRVAREIASGADARASAAQTIAWGVTGGAATLFVVVVLLGVTVSTSISRPLRRLARAAGVVAELSSAELMRVADSDSPDPAPPRLAAVEVNSSDEIGELATALNRVQATAALLLERQVSTRRNVAVMFANIARRTQNLVGRQLALIDDLERNERSPELMQRLYRLDHIATRLRRSADSLLVVSGTIDQQLSGTPTALDAIVRSSLAEIEGFRAVEIGEICEIGVAASAVGDLRLMVAELLENATNFSPPGAPVEVTAGLADDGRCDLRIVDHGVGMSQGRRDEENRRLVERERLDVAPTTVLGLFVVGRLARRHHLAVGIDATPGKGVTATIRIPSGLFTVGPVVVGKSTSALRVRPARIARDTVDAIEVPQPYGSFPWFHAADGPAAIAAAPLQPAEASPPPAAATMAPAPTFAAARASVDAVTSAAVPAGPSSSSSSPPDAGSWPPEPPPAPPAPSSSAWPPLPPPQPSSSPVASPLAPARLPQPVGGGPLPRREVGTHLDPEMTGALPGRGAVRRVPGSHLSDGHESLPPEEPTARLPRDPEAERAELNAYLSGLARSDGSADSPSHPNDAERQR